MSKIKIIAAMTPSGIIGKKNTLPWKKNDVPGELAWFKEATLGSVVIMGRNTWDSFPPTYRPLPDRTNVIISRTLTNAEGATIFSGLENALQAYSDVNVWIIGGAQLYAEALLDTDTLYLTLIDKEFEGDVYFPEFKNTFIYDETVKSGEGWHVEKWVKK